MAQDYVPSKDSKVSAWLDAIKKGINERGASFNLSPAEIAQANQYCDEYMAQIKTTYQAKLHFKSLVATKKKMRSTHLRPLRKLISKVKNEPNFVKAVSSLEAPIWTHQEKVETGTYKPALKARVASGLIEVKFKKKGIEGMQFQVKVDQQDSEGQWQTMPIRMYSPFYYKPEGYPKGALLRVTIRGRAVVKDELVGVPSDAVTIVYEVSPV